MSSAAELRIGVTGLARAGKTAFLTSLAANLLALGAGLPTLPALEARLAGRRLRVSLAPSGAADLPRFDPSSHLAALAADPPRWPARTGAVSLLALDLEISRTGLAASLPPRSLRLEFIDYPGEWLLDLPLLNQDFATWSASVLRRLASEPLAAGFLRFAAALPARAPADDRLAEEGHRLYTATLVTLRDEARLSFLQPGRFLMPAPGPPPPWTVFFPLVAASPLASLMAQRFDAYRDAVRRDLVSPLFGRLDGLVVLADLLTALHAGPRAYEDAAHALTQAAAALRWGRAWWVWGPLKYLFPGGIRRVAFAATKSDHVAARQRANLAALMGSLTPPSPQTPFSMHAIASVRCTEDFVWTLDGRNISAVRGRVIGQTTMTRSYPGEVPDTSPDPSFWAHPFLALPDFEPLRLPAGGRAGVAQIGLDKVLAFLLEDVL